MKIGNPMDRSTDHGPQNHRAHLEALLDYCQRGVDEGATLVYGGKQVDRPGMPLIGESLFLFSTKIVYLYLALCVKYANSSN